MPFLHGFRRVVYEYQPLVEAVMNALETKDGENQSRPDDGEGAIVALVDLLDRESGSPVFADGISYSLCRVAHLGLVSAGRVLLRYGADLNFEDPVSYYNPLHIAVLRNKPDMVWMLISQGADIEKRDRIHESSPIDLACEEADKLLCLRVLLDSGADVNAKDKSGKTALFHAMACADGLTVNNADNIQLLLERGADVNYTQDGDTVMAFLAFIAREALNSSVEDAKEIGLFCSRVAHLFLSHGGDACQGEAWNQTLIYTSLENFDLLFPLTALLLQHGAGFFCSDHWTGTKVIFSRLAEVLQDASDTLETKDVLAKAEVLLDLARTYSPVVPPLFPRSELDSETAPELLELYGKLEEQERSPLALRCLCRRLIVQCLKPWPFEEKVKALLLPDLLKELLLPEKSWRSRAGWDTVTPRRSPH